MRAILILFLILWTGLDAFGQNESNAVLLKNATIYVGNGERLSDGDVLISDGRIRSIGTDISNANNAQVIDLTGKYIMPGMIDAHVHFFQTGFFDARPDVVDIRDSIPYYEVCEYQSRNPERYYEAYLRSGVTGVYDVGGFTWSLDLIESAEDDPHAPHVAAAGPLLTHLSPKELEIYNTPADKVMISMQTEEQTRQAVRFNHTLGATGVKIWGYDTKDPEFEDMIAAANDEAQSLGNNLIAHATTLAQAKMALRHGAKLLVHGVADSIVDQEFIDLAKANDVIYNPTLIVTTGYILSFKSLRGVPLPLQDPHGIVDDRTMELLGRAGNFSEYRQSFMTDSTYLNMYDTWLSANKPRQDSIDHANLRLLHQAGIRLAVGTDAGNPGTLHGISIYDELEAMQEAGFTPEELIVMATKNGAQAMERYDDFGSLEVGKMADLIILERDPGEDISNVRSISHVMRNGFLFDVTEPLAIDSAGER